jgi:hypothetical protein
LRPNVHACNTTGKCFCSKLYRFVTHIRRLFFILFLQKEIREHDQQLARQFLQIYKDIQQTKVRKSCILHQEHLDALFDDTEVEKETPNMCDKPVKLRAKTLTCGVTRMLCVIYILSRDVIVNSKSSETL